MNNWTRCIVIWHITYLGQGYSILVQMKPFGGPQMTPPQKAVIFLLHHIAKTLKIFS